MKDVVDGDFQDIFAKHLMTNQVRGCSSQAMLLPSPYDQPAQGSAAGDRRHQRQASGRSELPALPLLLPSFMPPPPTPFAFHQDIVKLERSITELHQVPVPATLPMRVT